MPDEPLIADPARSAADSIGGYAYQLWYSLYAWLAISDDGFLVVEGAEDVDIISRGDVQAWQIKRTESRLTLGSETAREALNNYWVLKRMNPDRNIQYHFVTTSDVGQEKDSPFGSDVQGVSLWLKEFKTADEIRLLKAFLLKERPVTNRGRNQSTTVKLSAEVLAFIRTSTDEEFERQLVNKFRWETGSLSTEGIRRSVENRVVVLGESKGLLASEVTGVSIQLFYRVLKAATSKTERRLDRLELLTEFERITRKSVTLARYRQTEGIGTPSTPGVNPTSYGALRNPRPPLLGKFVARQSLEEKVNLIFGSKDLVYLQGSSGMGKTILANRVSPQEGTIWIGFRASYGGHPPPVDAILDQLAINLESKPDIGWVTLDDLDMSPDRLKGYQDALAAVLFTARSKRIKILMTGQKPLPVTFKSSCGDLPFEAITVAKFSKPEVEELLVAYGCPPAMVSKWALVVKTLTAGHPQLVHAKVIELSEQVWREPSHLDLQATSPSLDEAKNQATQLLSSRDVPSAELLGRLSLISGLFRRDQAIKVAETLQNLPLPGQVVERLVGPWIEPAAEGYFQVSPLLHGMADRTWSKEKIRELREEIGNAILECGNLALVEAENLIIQALLSSSDGLLQRSLPGIMSAPTRGLRLLAQRIPWVCDLRKDGLHFAEAVSWELLIVLQMIVAIGTRPAQVAALLDELKVLPPSPGLRMLKIWAVSQAFFSETAIPIRTRLRLLLEFLDLHQGPWEESEREAIGELADLQSELQDGGMNLEFSLMGTAAVYFSDADAVGEAIGAIDETPGLLALMQRCLAKDPYLAFIVVNKAWVAEELVEKPDWNKIIVLLDRILEIALRRDLRPFIEAVLCTKMIVLCDFLKDEAGAEAVFRQSFLTVPDASPYLKNGQAKFLLHQKRWEEALTLWGEAIPTMPTSPISKMVPIVARQEAAKAASHLRNWTRVVELYLEAAAIVDRFRDKDVVLHTGLLADAATAMWRAERTDEALRTFTSVLIVLETLPNTPDELRSFKLRKCVGQVLMNLSYHEDSSLNSQVYATPYGLCSDFEINDRFKSLPVGKGEFLWVLLQGLGDLRDTPDDVRATIGNKLRDQLSPGARALYFRSELGHDLRHRRFESFIRLSQDYLTAVHVAMQQSPAPNEPQPLQSFIPSLGTLDEEYASMVLDSALSLRSFVDDPRLPDFLASLEAGATGLPIEPILQKWALGVRAISMGQMGNWEEALVTVGVPSRTKLHAALMICNDRDSHAELLFRSHITCLAILETNVLRSVVGNAMAVHLADKWTKICDTRAAILWTPAISIPAVREACTSNCQGLQKVAIILLAVRYAVNVGVDELGIAMLRRIASKPIVV